MIRQKITIWTALHMLIRLNIVEMLTQCMKNVKSTNTDVSTRKWIMWALLSRKLLEEKKKTATFLHVFL